MAHIKQFNEFLNESLGNADNEYGTFFVSLLGLRDQAHIFHWQTQSFARHEAFGAFYEIFLEHSDMLAEMVMGIKGRPTLGSGAMIELKDYSDITVTEFIEESYKLINEQLPQICEESHEEVFDQARLIIAELDKLKYLLTLD